MTPYGSRTGKRGRAPLAAQARTMVASRFQPVGDIPAEAQLFDRIAEAVDIVRGGRFDAVECGACRYCPFATSCPVQNRAGKAKP